MRATKIANNAICNVFLHFLWSNILIGHSQDIYSLVSIHHYCPQRSWCVNIIQLWLWNRLLSGFINLKNVIFTKPIPKSMIGLFHENVLLLSNNNFIVILSVCLWFSRKTNVKRDLIEYWTTKEQIWEDSKSPVFPHLFLCLAGVISLSGHLPGSIFIQRLISQVLKTS